MDRVAVLVDAGYLFVSTARAIGGVGLRPRNLSLDHGELVRRLSSTATEMSGGMQLLRVYWYDGLAGGRLSEQQQEIASEPDVKLRLGVVSGGKQKGVDSLMVTDLLELARNGAITDAVILSGDADITVGVQLAQSYGARIHLLGIASDEGNQSDALRREADRTKTWTVSDLEAFASLPAETDNTEASERAAASTKVEEDKDSVRRLAASVQQFASNLAGSEIAHALETHTERPNRIPKDIDIQLLAACSAALGGRQLGSEERARMRSLFFEAIQAN